MAQTDRKVNAQRRPGVAFANSREGVKSYK